jgi:acyl-CoA oxidase
VPDGVGYLNGFPGILTKKCTVTKADDIANLNVIAEAYNVIAANLVKKIGEDFEACIARGLDADAAYEETGTFW